MISFPNCKINLGLSVTEKMNDGYHAIETVFYPVAMCDALEFVEADILQLSTSGTQIPGELEQNIILKAYHLLQKDYAQIMPLHIHLHKCIPTGGGLGGGSSNAAALLSMLNDYFELQLSKVQLSTYALNLGSDVPFFIYNQAMFAAGRGEIFTPIQLDLSACDLLLVMPHIHVPTAWAFSKILPETPSKSTLNIVQQSIYTWRNELKNDFEKVVFAEHPIMERIKEKLYEYGAIYAAMSGSGSTIYALVGKSECHRIKQQILSDELFTNMDIMIV